MKPHHPESTSSSSLVVSLVTYLMMLSVTQNTIRRLMTR